MGLNLIEKVLKVLERVVEEPVRQRVGIDDIQCGFMSGRGTTDTILLYLIYRRNTWLQTGRSTWPSLTLIKHLI